MSDHSLTALERAVLHEIGNQLSNQDRSALEAQIAIADVRRRENTGAGFFTYFDLGHQPVSKIQADVRRCYVGARIRLLEGNLGFILWTEDGCLDFLEGYTEGPESTAGLDLSSLDFELVASFTFSD